jgi:hypothetical protein
MSAPPEPNYGNLDPQKIVDTIERLKQRIGERFPESGLVKVCQQLDLIGENMMKRTEWIGRPVRWLRVLNFSLCGMIVLLSLIPLYFYFSSPDKTPFSEIAGDPVDLITLSEAAINDLVFIGIAIFFFLSFETRYKRQRALKAIHELRTIAHVIDMHQLTKDPHRITANQVFDSTTLSPKLTMTPFQLRRYLDYCSEMLSLVGKIAAVYVQHFDDAVALASVSELETLTTGLSNKIWQKIAILNMVDQETPIPKIHRP